MRPTAWGGDRSRPAFAIPFAAGISLRVLSLLTARVAWMLC